MVGGIEHGLEDIDLGIDVRIHASCIVDYPPSVSRALARKGVVTRRTVIGDRTEIMPFSTVYRGAWIGRDCLLAPHSTVREHATIGNRCVIGQYVSISFDADIEDEVRINTGSMIADGWRIGRGTFIGVGVVTMSDRRRDVVKYEFKGSQPTLIGERCLIGSGAVILPGLRIGDDVVIGAGALVTKDVPDGATVLGQPSRVITREDAWVRDIRTANGADHWRENQA